MLLSAAHMLVCYASLLHIHNSYADLPPWLSCRAESALQLSAKLLPHQMSTTFMQFKIMLLRSDTEAALECLQDVAASAEFTPEILQVLGYSQP
jgi:hypothetical protein